MLLTAVQEDALSELINIAYGRAADALSQMTGHRVRLEVPKIGLYSIPEMTGLLKGIVSAEVATVSQFFSGPVSGNALLILDRDAAVTLTRLLTDQAGEFDPRAPKNHEVITEFGNIVLSACLGVFGNLLQVTVRFSVPLLHIESVEAVIQSTTVGRASLSHALLIQTGFHLRDANLAGFLVIVLGVTSLQRLLQEVQRWQEQQTGG